ncbi:MAG: sensor domain-containing protein [Ignavibacteriales bacterium]|nr:sensor domain-containing protein [Ignavibacteriales bacterium]
MRTPRRAEFSSQNVKWLERLKMLVTDKYNWKMLLYMFCQLPFGTFYFILIVALVSLSLSFMVSPIIEGFVQQGVVGVIIGDVRYFPTTYLLPALGDLRLPLLTASMHLFKWIGQLHGKYAKMFLVTD